jgi:inosine/xanthosine triphosphate pyrophosphatase family protein
MLTLLTPDWRQGFSLQRELADYGISFENDDRPLTHIQSDSLEKYAIHLVEEGAALVGGPVFSVVDTLRITALQGLPGPYTLFGNVLGAKAVLTLMHDTPDRSAELVRLVAYAEPKGKPHVFTGGSKGKITETLAKGADLRNLTESLFVPEYRMLREEQTRTLFELGGDEPALVQHAWGTAVKEFAEWLKKSAIV